MPQAEEELARQQTGLYGRAGTRTSATGNQTTTQHTWSTQRDRVKIIDFLDKSALTAMVQQIGTFPHFHLMRARET